MLIAISLVFGLLALQKAQLLILKVENLLVNNQESTA
jgi:hypothetical protein